MTTKPLAETIKGLEALRDYLLAEQLLSTVMEHYGEVTEHIATLDAALTALREQGEPVAWVRMRNGEIDWSEDCLYPTKEDDADYEGEEGYTVVPLYAAPPQGEWVSVPREPTEAMWDAAWKSIGLPYRAKLSIHEIKTLFDKFHSAMLSAAPDGSQSQNGGKK